MPAVGGKIESITVDGARYPIAQAVPMMISRSIDRQHCQVMAWHIVSGLLRRLSGMVMHGELEW